MVLPSSVSNGQQRVGENAGAFPSHGNNFVAPITSPLLLGTGGIPVLGIPFPLVVERTLRLAVSMWGGPGLHLPGLTRPSCHLAAQ